MLRIIVLFSCVALLTGCAGSGPGVSSQQQQTCVLQFEVFPATGAADHQAKAPGNQVQFGATYGPTAESSCRPPTAVLMSAMWASSDPAVQMDSVPGQGNGTATCVGVTNGAATITASYTPMGAATATATATMSCK